MTIETKSFGIEIYADEGKAIKRKDDPHSKSLTTSVCIPLTQSANDWMDCDYGDPSEPSEDDVTEADKDAALTRLGVDMTEG